MQTFHFDKHILKDDIEYYMTELSIGMIKEYYPDIIITPNSVNIGRLYEGKNFYSCRIKFTSNGFICECKYLKGTGKFEIELYECTHIRKGGYGKMEGESESTLILYGSDIIKNN